MTDTQDISFDFGIICKFTRRTTATHATELQLLIIPKIMDIERMNGVNFPFTVVHKNEQVTDEWYECCAQASCRG